MHRVEPEIYVIAETAGVPSEISRYVRDIGVPRWDTDVPCFKAEAVMEVMGRLCYQAFGIDLNPNLTRVREGNAEYLKNIIKVRHGSVLEHCSVSFIFRNVSRVFTAELCRHRVGVAISEQSLRFVRLEDLGLWLPSAIEEDPNLVALFEKTFKDLGELQIELAKVFNLDNVKVPFSTKKELTSAMRRVAPLGLATSIGWTVNHRTLRHVLELRTSKHAEEEIRLVFSKVGHICKEKWPAIYADFVIGEPNDMGISEFIPEYSKI